MVDNVLHNEIGLCKWIHSKKNRLKIKEKIVEIIFILVSKHDLLLTSFIMCKLEIDNFFYLRQLEKFRKWHILLSFVGSVS